MNSYNINVLSVPQRREAIITALEKLPAEERERINNLANDLIRRIKLKRHNSRLSLEMAYEIFAGIGILMIRGVE